MKNKLLTKLLLLPVVLLMGSTAFAQMTVSGTVSDANGPVPGVNVVVQGTSNGAQTDFDGNYSISDVANDATLVFSYIGYATQEVFVNGQSSVDVTLAEDAQALAEVVVIGYGTTTVQDATGSVTAVTAKDFNQGVITSPEQLIQGKTAGVQISQSNGEPGAGIDIRIRGAASVRSNNNPLFVVDGIPLSGGNTSAETANTGVGSNAAKNPLAFINPNDIESISILKDASAAAIYGSRGANGVVFITTKSGKGAKGSSWEYSSSMAIASVAKTFDLLSAEKYLSRSNDFGFNVEERDFGSNTNWQDFIFRTSTSTNNDIAYSNNYGSGNLRATFGYSKNFGVVENTSLERITGRLNWNQRFLNDKLKIGVQSTLSRVNDEGAATAASAGFRGDLLGAAYSANPTWPTSPDFDGTGGLLSPATMLDYYQNLANTNRMLVNVSAEYALTSDLSARVNIGIDESESTRIGVSSPNARNFGAGAFGNGRGILSDLNTSSELLEATLNYSKDFGNSSLDILAGYSYQNFNRNGRTANAWGFFTENMNEMGDAIESTANAIEAKITGDYQQYGFAGNTGGIFVNRLFPDPATDIITDLNNLAVKSIFVDTFDNTDELQSYFGRVNYSINDKYLFTATVRADGSSRFGEDNQYGYFPSGAFAWKLHNEDFVSDAFSTLKLRLGAGITGNQEGLGYGNFTQRQRYAGGGPDDGGNINIPGIVDVSYPNPALKWEETMQYAAGLDFGFNNDRFNGSLDVYRKETSDLLFNVLAAQPSVQPFLFLNLPDSKVVNQGLEVSLGYDLISSDDLTWNATLNAAYNDNMVESLQGEFDAGTIRGQGLSLAFAQKLKAGEPLFSYFLREFEGFDPATGQPVQTDVQDFVGKSALPNLTGGLSTSLSYKRWTASAYFSGQFGHYIYNNTANAFFTAGAFRGGRNVTSDVLTAGESFDAAADVSTRFLESGDFVRFQNATVSYNWPLSGDEFFSSLVFSVTGQNLFVITDYSGLDPEVSSSPSGGDLLNGLPVFGIDYASYPRPRTFTFGLNAKF
ncbi:MAG: SusC/RagA family TonB-linked outer membrane protein [Flavobacteriaceae bacterium]|nr:SusC/RagA family TonB-linked outer membrane protein [Flavobacteriaceae bacterium]